MPYVYTEGTSRERWLAPKHQISHTIPYDLLTKIEQYTQTQQHNNRTRAINQLLELALSVVDKLPKLKDPEFVEEIRQQLSEGGLVDYVRKLQPKQFEILASIMDTEKKERQHLGDKS